MIEPDTHDWGGEEFNPSNSQYLIGPDKEDGSFFNDFEARAHALGFKSFQELLDYMTTDMRG